MWQIAYRSVFPIGFLFFSCSNIEIITKADIDLRPLTLPSGRTGRARLTGRISGVACCWARLNSGARGNGCGGATFGFISAIDGWLAGFAAGAGAGFAEEDLAGEDLMGAIVFVIFGLAGRLGGATGAGELFFAGLAGARGILAEKLIPPPRAG